MSINDAICDASYEGPALTTKVRPGIGQFMSGIFRAWKNRAAVNELRHLTESQLTDLGLSPSDIHLALQQSMTSDPSHYLIGARSNPLKNKRRA